MPSYIIRLDDGATQYFMEWSTIVDAPITNGMPRKKFVAYYLHRYGNVERKNLAERMERADKTGCSSLMGDSLEILIACNRAGKNETTLTLEQIVEFYCRNGGTGEKPTGTEE